MIKTFIKFIKTLKILLSDEKKVKIVFKNKLTKCKNIHKAFINLLQNNLLTLRLQTYLI